MRRMRTGNGDGGRPKDPRILRVCDVCQKAVDGGSSGPPSHWECWKCPNCGSNFVYNFRKDGEVFDVPRAWGRCVGSFYWPTSVGHYPDEDEPTDEEKQVENSNPLDNMPPPINGEVYYVFQADDGTLRRAEVKHGSFDSAIEGHTHFYYWDV